MLGQVINYSCRVDGLHSQAKKKISEQITKNNNNQTLMCN